MGMYDVTANIEFIKKKSGNKKIYYIGYNQGTTQMFYGLIKNGTDISDSLHKYVALAPCSVAQVGNTHPDKDLFKLQEIGVYALYNTPNWDDDLENKICKNLDKAYCERQREFTSMGY